MPQYWLKPLGVTQPPAAMPNEWTVDENLDSFELMTGPATNRQPPRMGPGDRVLFHAVIHARMFAEAEILDAAVWRKDPKWGLRWPWVYPSRVDVWVPRIEDGVQTSDVAPKASLGHIQLGGDYARLEPADYEEMLNALEAKPEAQRR